MAATSLMLLLTLCWISPAVCVHVLYRLHVSAEGGSVHAPCLPHDNTYTSRQWRWEANHLRPESIIYHQKNGGPLDAVLSRPDIVLDPADFSITIGNLRVNDTGRLFCDIATAPGAGLKTAVLNLGIYNRWVDTRLGDRLTLSCPVPASNFDRRQWYYWPDSNNQVDRIYYQDASGVVYPGNSKRSEISLDADSFDLTVSDTISYDFKFTCLVHKQLTTNAGFIFNAIYTVVMEAEEGSAVTLPCDMVERWTRSGYHSIYSRTWQRVTGGLLYYQLRYDNVFHDYSPAVRSDITLNNETFALTIGRVRLEDDTMFVCNYIAGLGGENTGSVKLVVYKTPLFTDIHPNEGPLSGGTKLTLTGSYLSRFGLVVKLGTIECPTTFKNTTVVLCVTPPGGATELNAPLRISVTWGGAAGVHNTTEEFTYRPDPTVTKLQPRETILSGGTRITVTGDGLNVVGEAGLQVTVLYEAVAVHVFQSICQIVSSTTMHCPVPKIDILGPDGNIDLSASPRRKREVKILRSRRQVDGNITEGPINDGRIDDDKIDFRMGLLLDGVSTYRNLTEALPQYAQLTVYSNPQVYRWAAQKLVTRTNRTLQVKGERLLVGIQSTDYRMLIGQSECSSLVMYSNLLICTAPKDPPAPHHMDQAGGPLSVRVHIGVLEEPFLVGTLHYELSFFDDPIAKWGIIGAAAVIGVILLIVTVICLVKKYRTMHTSP